MKKGYIKITEPSTGKYKVEAQLVDGNLWLTAIEMAHLFDVVNSSISNTLKAVFKAGMLKEEEVIKYYNYTDEKGKERTTVYYNLETLILLSFRVASPFSKVIRQWVLDALQKVNQESRKEDSECIVVWNYDNGTVN